MAIYRNVSMNFWSDTKIVDEFSPEDKYFMLYCLTNQYTNLCGCYEISVKQMVRDTGYNEETITKLLDRFNKKYKIIKYNKDNKELFIINWFKYNWTKSEKLNKPLLEEIKNIKTAEYKKELSELYNKRDTVSIPYTYPIDTTVSVSVTDTVSDTDIYGEFKNVKLSKEEYRKLEELNLIPYIETLSSYMKSRNKRYKDHYATIRNWSRRENKKEEVPEWFDKKLEVDNTSTEEMENILKELEQ